MKLIYFYVVFVSGHQVYNIFIYIIVMFVNMMLGLYKGMGIYIFECLENVRFAKKNISQ